MLKCWKGIDAVDQERVPFGFVREEVVLGYHDLRKEQRIHNTFMR